LQECLSSGFTYPPRMDPTRIKKARPAGTHQ
jgi:hypothetical protein